MYKTAFRSFVLIVFTVFLTTFVHAQENAIVTGSVYDPSQAAVLGAEITLTHVATGQTRTTTSNASGLYSFANVGVGEYTLTATASGFQKYVKSGIVVNVAQTLRADVNLTIGATNTEVSVRADALQLQTVTNELSNLISGEQVTPSCLSAAWSALAIAVAVAV